MALTREGWRFVLLLGIVAFAAYNTKNNLLYLMLSVGLAAVAAAIAAGWWSLRALAARSFTCPDAYPGLPFHETFDLVSSARLAGSFGLVVEGDVEVAYLAPGASHRCRVERLYRRRGRYRGDPVVVTTRFPFGLFRICRKLPAEREIVVYPRIHPVDPALLRLEAGRAPVGLRQRGMGDEFYRLREYVPGDHVHYIHWRSSAKLDQMIVRELAEETEEHLTIGLVNLRSETRDEVEFERLVSAAASLVSYAGREGRRYRFLSESFEWAPGREGPRERLRDILRYLAEVEPREALDPELVRRLEAARARGERTVLVGFEEHRALLPELTVIAVEMILPHERSTAVDSRSLV